VRPPTPDGQNCQFRRGQRQPGRKNRASTVHPEAAWCILQLTGNPKRKSVLEGESRKFRSARSIHAQSRLDLCWRPAIDFSEPARWVQPDLHFKPDRVDQRSGRRRHSRREGQTGERRHARKARSDLGRRRPLYFLPDSPWCLRSAGRSLGLQVIHSAQYHIGLGPVRRGEYFDADWRAVAAGGSRRSRGASGYADGEPGRDDRARNGAGAPDQSSQSVYAGPCHRRGDRAGHRHLAVRCRSEPGPFRFERRAQHNDWDSARRRERFSRQQLERPADFARHRFGCGGAGDPQRLRCAVWPLWRRHRQRRDQGRQRGFPRHGVRLPAQFGARCELLVE